MVDHVSIEKRSQIMAAVHNKGNYSTEKKLSELLVKNGILGWVQNANNIIGKPDFVFEKEKLIIFADGCFWHGCKKHKSLPRSNLEFWRHKICNNVSRDNRIRRKLRRHGWHVLQIWEHDIKNNEEKVVRKINRKIKIIVST